MTASLDYALTAKVIPGSVHACAGCEAGYFRETACNRTRPQACAHERWWQDAHRGAAAAANVSGRWTGASGGAL
jgi:hypothetical protein